VGGVIIHRTPSRQWRNATFQLKRIVILKNPLGRLRVIGIVEGASFLLLLFIAMPLKYIAGMPQYVTAVGAIHGALWMIYLASIIDVRLAMAWPWKRCAVAFGASIVPFGPFLLEPSLRAEQQARELAAVPATIG
jgi:integral membrane protein